MPARLTSDPLGIACVFSDGTALQLEVAGAANPVLARDLLAGLVELVHPHGTVDAAGTVRQYRRAALNVVRQ